MTKQRGQMVCIMVLAVFITVIFIAMSGLRCKAFAQGNSVIYPAKGQSQQTQEKDKYQCYTWAKGQTGFDPMNTGSTPAPTPPPQGPTGERVVGAARGAAVGAVVGGIAGDAGKGAAAGAAGGAMIGGMKKRQRQAQQAQAYQQQASAASSKQAEYNRAFAACMEGRGYTVK